MARIRVACRAGKDAGHRGERWFAVVDGERLRRQLAEFAGKEDDGGDGEPAWEVCAYEGLPDFGPHPDLNELLAYLDAMDEYGAAFAAWWAQGGFTRVIPTAEAFADRYQGRYADLATWARHTLELMGEGIEGVDLAAYADAALVKGEVQIIEATEGGIHVFWND
ncbi:antirestriction protein ArdA [Stenotrophomonas maltophilia]|uniref:antirestriction protein ArdA n=1 Tax=Stenotrophomonas maltophilia TaxID=40324 RepID=UPI00313CFB84